MATNNITTEFNCKDTATDNLSLKPETVANGINNDRNKTITTAKPDSKPITKSQVELKENTKSSSTLYKNT